MKRFSLALITTGTSPKQSTWPSLSLGRFFIYGAILYIKKSYNGFRKSDDDADGYDDDDDDDGDVLELVLVMGSS